MCIYIRQNICVLDFSLFTKDEKQIKRKTKEKLGLPSLISPSREDCERQI